MGGFYNAPICLASIFSRTSLFLHEANAVLGKSHQIFQHFSKRIFSFFSIEVKSPKKLISHHFPLREEFLNISQQNTSQKKTIFIFGGSQGSQFFNQKLSQFFNQKVSPFKIIHLSGNIDNKQIIQNYKETQCEHIVLKNTENMHEFYAKADLVICRAGASSIAEIISQNKKAILIPYPHASEEHQKKNAQVISKKFPNQFCLIEEKTINKKILIQKIKELLKNKIPKDNGEGFYFSGEKLLQSIKKYS